MTNLEQYKKNGVLVVRVSEDGQIEIEDLVTNNLLAIQLTKEEQEQYLSELRSLLE